MPESTSTTKDTGRTYCPFGGIDRIMRAQREHQAWNFKKMYKIKNDCPEEEKTIILPCASSISNENSFGITYVAVRETIGLTIVAFKKTMATISDRLNKYLLRHHEDITFDLLGKTIISEIEVGLDNPRGPSTEIPYSCGVHVHKHFAIVSVVPNAENDNGENANKVAAVNYLTGIMKKDEDFNPGESRLIVIKALQLLMNEEFKPEDVWVHVACLGKDEGMRDYQIEYVWICSR